MKKYETIQQSTEELRQKYEKEIREVIEKCNKVGEVGVPLSKCNHPKLW